MRKFLLLLIFPLFGNILNAQDIQENISYGFDEYIEKCTNIPTVRNINGGTIFNVTYGDGWTLEMKGAFEYACKIWEENLPTCLPINIKAEIGTIRSSLNLTDNEIEIQSTNERISAIRSLDSYSIQSLDQNNSLMITGKINGDNASIDIS